MKRTLLQLQAWIQFVSWPIIWAHEYCHYWTARRLGLLARIQATKTYVHRVTRSQHILIAIAPTIPHLILFGLSVAAFQNLAVTSAARRSIGALAIFSFFLLLSCALDWWTILRSLLSPNILEVDSHAILFISSEPARGNRSLRARLERMGYFTAWTRSGPAAVAAVRRNPFNLIVMDPNVPDLDLNTFRMEVGIHQVLYGPKIVTLNSPEELAKLPRYLETGLPEDQFLGS